MEDFLHDLKHSLRMFRRSPGFTIAAVAALALGIGTNTAIFSVVNSILLKPAPFPDPDRLVMFQNTSPQGSFSAASPAKFFHWRAQSNVVQDAAAFRTGVVNLTGGDVPEQLPSAEVSADYFRLFGAPILMGRSFTEEEDLPRGARVALISHGLWIRRFAADRQVAGRAISLGGEPHIVIGVVSPSFDFRDFGPAPDVWVPFQLDPNTPSQGHYFQAAGRLRPGVTLTQAQERFKTSAAEYIRKYPNGLQSNQSFSVAPIREAIIGNVRSSLWVLTGAVSFVLLIACANVANLLLARAIGRRHEMAIRAAIGAGRGRLVRQLLTESVLLSLTGAAIGSALGLLGIRALLSINTANLPRVGQDGALVVVDWRVLVFTVLVAVATGLVFGLIPALQSSRADLSATLKESAGRSGTGFRQNKARTLLVVTEIALAVVLLVGAALLIRTSLALGAVDPGFKTDNVITMRMSLRGAQYTKSAAVDRLIRDGVDRLRSVPGVVVATAACCVPLQGGYGLGFLIVGRPLEKGPFHGGGAWLTISPGYFEAFRIPIVRGRAFTERDTQAGTPVVVINQAMARQFWPKADPLGEQIWIGKGSMPELATETPRQIVGIAGDVRGGALNREPGPTMYIPNAQVPDALNALNIRITPLSWIVRTQSNPLAISAALQEQLRQASGLPISNILTMDDVVSRSTSRQRFNMLLMTVFGAAALFLAAIGIYGLMAYSVHQRTQEIGIRLALGADSSQVRSMVVFQGMRLALLGVALGIAAAFGLTRLISTFLYGVEARDVASFATVLVLLTLVSLIAVWVPARRATRIDPVIALRYE